MRNRCISAAIVVALSFPLAARGQCDPLLIPDESELKYRKKDARRCEGLYVGQMGGTLRLDLVGFCAVDVKTFRPLSEVFVTWPDRSSAVHLRARSLDRPLFYRFDADLTGGSYRWRTDVLNPADVKPQALVVTGWRSMTFLGDQRIYIPVRVATTPLVIARPTYRFVVVPTHDLSTVHTSIEGLRVDGSFKSLPDARLITTPSIGPYAAGMRIEIDINAASLPKFPMWRLHMSGTSTAGMNVVLNPPAVFVMGQ